MTPEQVQLIKASWAKVLPIKEIAADLFYGKLFELEPGVKTLFSGDIKEQGRKLMMLLNTVVINLERLDSLIPTVQELGRKHVDYDVKPEHYDAVGQALIWTLGKGLGDSFTDDVEAAWVEAYTTLATVMKQAAYG